MRPNYSVELASGVFIVLGIAALVWLATTATDYGRDLGDETYQVQARFSNVAELRNRSPVRIGGVTVGLVDDVQLDPVTFEALVTMRIDQRYNDIPTDTSASIVTAGVLGDRYIALEPGGSPDALQDGDELFLTQSAIVLESLVGKFLFNAGEGNAGDEDESESTP